jgi:hypothetical protein
VSILLFFSSSVMLYLGNKPVETRYLATGVPNTDADSSFDSLNNSMLSQNQNNMTIDDDYQRAKN